MSLLDAAADPGGEDLVGKVLKWVLLVTAVTCFAVLAWTTKQTYQAAPPFPDRFVGADGQALMTADDIQAGKAGFQKADLMDYGSLYGMGSYFGEDYTADSLKRLAELTEANIAQARFGKPLAALADEDKAAVQAAMQGLLQHVDLNQRQSLIAPPLAAAISARRGEIVQQLLSHDFEKGWTKAYALDAGEAAKTADFLIYSSLTTVARRPGSDASWTQNWPFEPLVGNTPTASTFTWTWASFAFVFLGFGAVIFIY